MLPEVVEDIKSSYQDLQVSAVEENFEALSDVLEDTQTLMAGLTERLRRQPTKLLKISND